MVFHRPSHPFLIFSALGMLLGPGQLLEGGSKIPEAGQRWDEGFGSPARPGVPVRVLSSEPAPPSSEL